MAQREAAASQQADGSGKDADVEGIGNFATLEIAEFGFGIELGREQANRVDGAASVSGVSGLGGIESVAGSPNRARPGSLRRCCQ